VNTDDPALFDTTLSEEFRRVGEAYAYTPEILANLALAGARHSFLPEAEKTAYLAAMRDEILAAATRHLGRELEI
jgi:adenosine deaminase